MQFEGLRVTASLPCGASGIGGRDTAPPEGDAFMPIRHPAAGTGHLVRLGGIAAATALALIVSACNTEPQLRGYIPDEKALGQLKPGEDAQAVLQTMGTPSTVSTVGNQTWYYISQTTTQRLRFMKPTIVDQRVLVVVFNKNMKVERVASYGLQDGVVFDFISRTTPTSGAELTLVRQLLGAAGAVAGAASPPQ